MLGTLATVVLQAIALHTTLSIFLDPDANAASLGIPDDRTGTFELLVVLCLLWVVVKIPGLMRRYVTRGGGGGGQNVAGLIVRMVLMQQLTSFLRLPKRRTNRRAVAAGAAAHPRGPRGGVGSAGGSGGGGTGLPQPRGGADRGRPLPPPRGAGRGQVGVAWPTGRRIGPYSRQEIAAGVDPYTRTVPKRAAAASAAASRSTRPPIRAAGLEPPLPAPGPRPVIPAGVNPATAMPKARPQRPPVTGPWNRPTRRR